MSKQSTPTALSIDELLCRNEDKQELPQKSKVVSSYTVEERERVRRRVGGFDWKQSRVWRDLTAHFGPKVNHEELISIAELISKHANIKLDRDAKRRKVVLVKWFQEHWSMIQPLLGAIVLDDY